VRAKPYSVGQRPYSVVHPGGSGSLRKILTMPPHGWRAKPPGGSESLRKILTGNAPIPSCTPPPMASKEAEPPKQ